ncbi:MAG: LapA family protein [Candidatus Manganitrophaceae bacterium]|nr:MAG: LapA family protein [Candidatus Manganitrophaceae bacterium]
MIRLILLIVAVFFLFTFSYMNQEEGVTLHFIWGPTPPLAVYLIVIGSFFVGILFAALMTFPGWLKMKLERRKLAKRIEALESDLDHLRSEALKVSTPRYPSLSTDLEDSQDDTMGEG